MAVDHTRVLDIPGAVTETIAQSRVSGRRLNLARSAPFPVAVVGPPGAGKTTILKEVHGGQLPGNGLVPGWHARLTEYPGIERAADLRGEAFAGLWRDPVGILYVLPSRGLNDEDEQALEMLRSRSVVTLENIHEKELHPARTSIVPLERPDVGCPFTVPIVPLMRAGSATGMQAEERQLLRLCVAFLRHATLPATALPTLRQQATAAQAALRTDINGQWRQILALASDDTDIYRLDALRRLLDLGDDCTVSVPYDAQLTELIRLVELSGSASPALLLRQLRDQAYAAADRYNIEAGRRPAPAAARRAARRATAGTADGQAHDGTGKIDFGAGYVQERQHLLGFLNNVLAQRSQLNLLDEEQESITRLQRKVHEDNIDIALLGRFSSGKSSVINSLLGVPVDDRNPRLLPTDVRPETATVNRVCHSPDEGVKAEWLKRAELIFATETSDPGQLRLHRDEIKSLHAWLSGGQVTPQDLTFTALPEEFAGADGTWPPPPSGQLEAFHKLWEALGFPNPTRNFVYEHSHPATPKLPDPRFPASATVARLPRASDHLRGNVSRSEMFAAIKGDVSLALLVDRLNIGFDHPLLRHASFIDTPGTDAPIPHHRRVAQEIIRQQNCPVIYCFLGERPGGTEDTHNLQALKEWGIGSTNLNRFFFVITMKHSIAEEDRESVRDYVRRCLQEIGITATTLYFVDVVHYPDDPEFRALKADVEKFIDDSKAELFGSWLGQARAVVNEARARCIQELEAVTGSEQERAERVAKLKRQQARLDALAKDFLNSASWGAPWARGRVSSKISTKAAEIAQIIDGLRSKKEFDNVESLLSDALAELNRSTMTTVTTTHSGLLGKLQSAVAEIRPGTSVQVSNVTAESDLFPSAGVLDAARNPYWRSIIKRSWQRVIGREDFHADVGHNRDRIAGPWQESRDRGAAVAKSLIETSIEDMQSELKRISASVKAELDAASRPSSSLQHKDTLEQACALGAEWLSRLDALGRQSDSRVGGSS
jgi:hypothetical protein